MNSESVEANRARTEILFPGHRAQYLFKADKTARGKVMSVSTDALIIGNGPAGALTAAFLARNLQRKVHVVAPDSGHCTYCTWVDALEATWLKDAYPGELFLHRWPRPQIIGTNSKLIGHLNRDYGMVDWKRIHIWALAHPNITLIRSNIVRVDASHAVDEQGTLYNANEIIDASGHHSPFTTYPKHLVKRFQSFYGETIQFKHGFQHAQLMNWSLSFEPDAPPSFVYVLPLSSTSVFLEETVLVHEKPVLNMKKRLEQRKRSLGIPLDAPVTMTEAYDLPMGGALPLLTGMRAIGGAASMVHPATGYMLTHMVEQIPKLWQPATLTDRIRHRLNDFGAFMLCRLKTNQDNALFFKSMFQTPWWYEFMTRRIGIRRYVLNMIILFLIYPERMRLVTAAWDYFKCQRRVAAGCTTTSSPLT